MLFIPHIRYQLKNWLGFPKHSSFARFVVYHLNSRHLYVRSSNGSFNQVYGIQISAVLVLSNFSHKLTPIISSGNFELLAVVKTSFIVSVVFHLSQSTTDTCRRLTTKCRHFLLSCRIRHQTLNLCRQLRCRSRWTSRRWGQASRGRCNLIRIKFGGRTFWVMEPQLRKKIFIVSCQGLAQLEGVMRGYPG